MDLFGALTVETTNSTTSDLANVPPAGPKELLAWEKEFLGLYLTSHPLMEITGQGAPDGCHQVAEIEGRGPGSKVRLLGMVSTIRRITTKANRTMAVLEVEDLTGTIEVVAFPDCYEQHAELIQEDAVLEFHAKVDERGEKLQLILESLLDDLPIAKVAEAPQPTVTIRLQSSDDLWEDIRRMQRIDDVLRRNEGDQRVQIELAIGADRHVFASRSRRVEWGVELTNELSEVIGTFGTVDLVQPDIVAQAEEDPAQDDSLLAVA
jgi:DNA polymerase-3 subunit alpha